MAGLRLKNKIALITGAARGQGAAESVLFAREGATVIVTDVLEKEGRTLADDLISQGYSADFYKLDVTDSEDWARVVREVDAKYDGLDILINNAGINLRQQLTDMSREDWDRLLDINLTGPMLGLQACVPLMRKRKSASVVNVGSLSGLMGHPTTGYSAAKWGLRGLTKSAAMDLVGDNIRVNAIHPGLVDTPIIDSEGPYYKQVLAMTPMQRSGHPDELAYVALFLASDESSFITGVDIPVDGGLREFGAYNHLWKQVMLEL